MWRSNVVITGGGGKLGPRVIAAFLRIGINVYAPLLCDSAIKNQSLNSYLSSTQLSDSELAHLFITYNVNLSNEEDVRSYYDRLPQLIASIHLAGSFLQKSLMNTTKVDIIDEMNSNFVTSFLCSQASLKKLMHKGAIINIASRRAPQHAAAYIASKAAVASITKSIALADENVRARVYCLSPYIIDMDELDLDTIATHDHISANNVVDLIMQLCVDIDQKYPNGTYDCINI